VNDSKLQRYVHVLSEMGYLVVPNSPPESQQVEVDKRFVVAVARLLKARGRCHEPKCLRMASHRVTRVASAGSQRDFLYCDACAADHLTARPIPLAEEARYLSQRLGLL
jgi:hypothetical protein